MAGLPGRQAAATRLLLCQLVRRCSLRQACRRPCLQRANPVPLQPRRDPWPLNPGLTRSCPASLRMRPIGRQT